MEEAFVAPAEADAELWKNNDVVDNMSREENISGDENFIRRNRKLRG